jgi:N-carbamoyl-L-amino-acid hydrolase
LTLRLANWADEEGRFGHSLLGSSAVAGLLQVESLLGLRDAGGAALQEVLPTFGLKVESLQNSRRQIADIVAYLELHIEQGPVLWQLDRALGVVTGTKGVRRSSVRFTGQSAHAGSTPMAMRHDALVAAARFVAAVRELAARARSDAVCTVGVVEVEPGVPTVIPGECRVVVDQRSIDESVLSRLRDEAQRASEDVAAQEGVSVSWKGIYEVPATPFNSELVEICHRAVSDVSGDAFRLPSGPLHDATAMARAGIPTGMIFVQSIGGLSHVIDENTADDHIRLGVRAECRAAEICLAEMR